MRDDDGATGEILQCIFECTERFGVEIVGRLIEQQHITTGFQKLGQMHPVALTAGQRADLLLLVAALEVEGRAIGTGIHLVPAELDDVITVGNLFPDTLVAIQ